MTAGLHFPVTVVASKPSISLCGIEITFWHHLATGIPTDKQGAEIKWIVIFLILQINYISQYVPPQILGKSASHFLDMKKQYFGYDMTLTN